MKRILCLLGIALAFGVGLGANAQENLKGGKVISRVDLKGAPGWEAILVERTLPAGVESGKHTQAGNEIVYIQSGAVIFEAEGKPAQTVKAGEAFTTSPGEVHNVKNASKTEECKALAYYVAKKGAKLEELSVPAK